MVDPPTRWPLMKRPLESLQCGLVAYSLDLDATVSAVAHKAAETLARGHLASEETVPNPLHMAGDHEPASDHHGASTESDAAVCRQIQDNGR